MCQNIGFSAQIRSFVKSGGWTCIVSQACCMLKEHQIKTSSDEVFHKTFVYAHLEPQGRGLKVCNAPS